MCASFGRIVIRGFSCHRRSSNERLVLVFDEDLSSLLVHEVNDEGESQFVRVMRQVDIVSICLLSQVQSGESGRWFLTDYEI